MLRELYIQDIVLIERLTLTIGEGLTALTGETGAGKSVMLDALGLAVGGRAEKSLVRQGAKNGVVSAGFQVKSDHPVWEVLEENGIAANVDEGEVILRRLQAADGPSRAFINDQPVSVGFLKNVGDVLLEVHGQHQGHGFFQTSVHRSLLDQFGGHGKLQASVKEAWQAWRSVSDELNEKLEDRERAAREIDYLRHVVEELSELNPQEDEEETLAERRATLMASEKVTNDLSDAASLMSDDSMEVKLSAAISKVERAFSKIGGEGEAVLNAVVERVDTALAELQEARSAIDHAIVEFQYDANELNEVEERLFALRAAARKFNCLPNQLHHVFQKAEESLSLLQEGENNLAQLEKRVSLAKKQYDQKALALSDARQKASAKLEKAVAKELKPLKLEKAKFHVSVDRAEAKASVDGIDAVQFLIATNPGAPLGPLKQIASGGELSRFVLALKAALMVKEDRTVIIFDEVDAGIGGAVADAVGERLAKLAAGAQVLVVTHSPQVAARAAVHFFVSKSGKKKVSTTITKLAHEERVEEIARMLSGAEVTEEARAAAMKLMGNTEEEIAISA